MTKINPMSNMAREYIAKELSRNGLAVWDNELPECDIRLAQTDVNTSHGMKN